MDWNVTWNRSDIFLPLSLPTRVFEKQQSHSILPTLITMHEFQLLAFFNSERCETKPYCMLSLFRKHNVHSWLYMIAALIVALIPMTQMIYWAGEIHLNFYGNRVMQIWHSLPVVQFLWHDKVSTAISSRQRSHLTLYGCERTGGVNVFYMDCS